MIIDEENHKERVGELKALFKETQSLPQIQTLSEDDILREVETYRFLQRFRKLRERMMAESEKTYTDEEIFEIVS